MIVHLFNGGSLTLLMYCVHGLTYMTSCNWFVCCHVVFTVIIANIHGGVCVMFENTGDLNTLGRTWGPNNVSYGNNVCDKISLLMKNFPSSINRSLKLCISFRQGEE